MAAQTFYHIALSTHIIGLTVMAGTTLVDYIITKQFWKQYAVDKQKGLAVNAAVSKLPMLFGIGIILLILSGVGMMALTNGVFGEQVWFRIKFALVIIIIINGLAFGRRLGIKLKKLLTKETLDEHVEAMLLKIKSNLNLFHIVQMALFITVFVLSVFKFN